MKIDKKYHQKIPMAVILVLTLGLAPFYPEPHLFGKIRWIAGGAQGMQVMDYFDLMLHGAPWIYLIVVFVLVVKSYLTTSQ